MRTTRRALFAATAIVILAPALQAQERAPLGIDRRPATIGVATINPFAIILGGFNGDVELNLGTGFTGALSGTIGGKEFDYSTVDLTFRYYPQEQSPRGFSIGASIGYLHLNKDDDDFGEPRIDETRGPTIGFIAGYTWLIGRRDRLAIATGFGLKRVFDNLDRADPEEIAPTGRLGIGLTF